MSKVKPSVKILENNEGLEFTVYKDPIEEGQYIYKKSKFWLKPGVTCLIGCNGSGKTTLFNSIYDIMQTNDNKSDDDATKINNVKYIRLNNYSSGSRELMQQALFMGDMSTVLSQAQSSEGEQIVGWLCKYASSLGTNVRSLEKGSHLIVSFDAIDSGLSYDNIVDVRNHLFSPMLDDAKKRGINLYILVATNTYALCDDASYDKMFIHNFKHIKVNSYKSFVKYVIKSREIKDNR